jgi:hypothetical protein
LLRAPIAHEVHRVGLAREFCRRCPSTSPSGEAYRGAQPAGELSRVTLVTGNTGSGSYGPDANVLYEFTRRFGVAMKNQIEDDRSRVVRMIAGFRMRTAWECRDHRHGFHERSGAHYRH